MNSPSSLVRDISPPPSRSAKHKPLKGTEAVQTDNNATPAAVEAGKASVDDHLTYFSKHLCAAIRPRALDEPRMSIDEFTGLYMRNQHPHGHHFVVHQHNHPVAGVHYDLRLQFSKSSSISFAIPYGLPGNPYSRRQGRMAIETRVHNLWNHLIESASHLTGSLSIWDTGEYEVVASTSSRPQLKSTDDEASDIELLSKEPENERLIQAFQSHSIHLRLYGVRLPQGYTISLRLPSNEFGGSRPPGTARKRRRKAALRATSTEPTDDESDTATVGSTASSRFSTRSIGDADETAMALASEDEEDAQTRANNAYPGSTNSIGSIHQRRWFLTLDKLNSGFVKEGGKWVRGKLKSSKRKLTGHGNDRPDDDSSSLGGFEPFTVRGAEFEKSVITGRLSKEVMDDEDVQGFVERKRWKPISE